MLNGRDQGRHQQTVTGRSTVLCCRVCGSSRVWALAMTGSHDRALMAGGSHDVIPCHSHTSVSSSLHKNTASKQYKMQKKHEFIFIHKYMEASLMQTYTSQEMPDYKGLFHILSFTLNTPIHGILMWPLY